MSSWRAFGFSLAYRQISFLSTLKRRCFFCFTRDARSDSEGVGNALKELGPEPEEETEVRADAVLSAGEAERGLVEFEMELAREWVVE